MLFGTRGGRVASALARLATKEVAALVCMHEGLVRRLGTPVHTCTLAHVIVGHGVSPIVTRVNQVAGDLCLLLGNELVELKEDLE